LLLLLFFSLSFVSVHAKLLLRFRARFFRLQEEKRGMRDVFDRFSLPRERLARGEPAEIFSSPFLRLPISLSVSCFYRRRSFRRGLHRVFICISRGEICGEKLEKKKSTFSLHFLADGSMFTMKLPHLLLLPLLLGCALLLLSLFLSLRVGFLVVIIVSTLFLFFSTYIQKLFCL